MPLLWALALLPASLLPPVHADCFKIASPPKDYVRTHVRSPDFTALLSDADFLLVPDVHEEAFIKAALVRHMPELRRAGISHLALEMIPSDALVKGLGEAGLRRLITDYFIGSNGWPADPYVRLIQAAAAQGIEIRGINFTKDKEEEIQLLLREGIRNSFNVGDAHMARKAASVGRETPGAKVLIFAGAAHLNTYYDDDNPENKVPNTRMLGELWQLGVPRARIRSMEIRRFEGFNVIRSQPLYLALPTGVLPGCGRLEAHSALDGILYAPYPSW